MYTVFPSIAQEPDGDKPGEAVKKGKKVLDGAGEMVYDNKSAPHRRTVR